MPNLNLCIFILISYDIVHKKCISYTKNTLFFILAMDKTQAGKQGTTYGTLAAGWTIIAGMSLCFFKKKVRTGTFFIRF